MPTSFFDCLTGNMEHETTVNTALFAFCPVKAVYIVDSPI